MSIKKVFTTFVVITTCVWSMGLFALPVTAATTVAAGDRVQMSGSKAVYLLDSDMKRWVFPNEATYETWYPGPDYSGLKVLTADEIAAYPLAGKNVAYRPGQKAIKVDTDPKVYSLGPGGVLHHIASEEIYIALYGSNAWVDIDVVPDWLFASYTVGTQLTTKVHPDGTLVNYAGDDNTYVISSGKKRLISSAEAFAANRFDSDKVITTTIAYEDGTQVTGAETNYTDPTQAWVGNTTGGDVTPGTTTGDVAVSLASDTPSSSTYISGSSTGQALADMTHFTFKNNGTAETKVTKILMKRLGVTADTTMSALYLYDGATRLTDAATVSSTVITFNDASGLFTLAAGASKTISVKANIASGASGQTIGVGIVASTDVTTSPTGTVGGTFPMNGNLHSLASASLATVDFNTTTTPATTTITPQDDYTMWQNIATVGTRKVYLKSLSLRQIGSIQTADLANFELYVDGVKKGDTLAALGSNGYITWDLSATPVTLEAGSRVIKVMGDIINGSSRTFSFSLQQATDVMVVDSELNQPILSTANGSSFSARTSGTETIDTGVLTFAKKTDSPSGNVVTSSTNVLLAKYDVKASGEKMKVESLRVRIDDDDNDTTYTLRNGALYLNGAQVGSTAAIAGDSDATLAYTEFTFGSSFIVTPGTTSVLEVRADIYNSDGSNDVIATDTIQVELGAGTSNTQRMTSLGYGTYPASYTEANTLTVATGALSVAKNTSYADQSIVAPKSAYKVGAFNVQANATEAATITSIVVDFDTVADAFDASDDLTNLYIKVGSYTSTAKATVTDTANTFSTNISLTAGQTLPVEVYADVATSSTDGDGTADTAISSITVSYTTSQSASSTSATEVPGQTITSTTGSFTVSLDGSSQNNRIVAGNQKVEAAKYKFQAVNDTYTINELTISVNTAAIGSTVSEVQIYDGTTAVATGGSLITDDANSGTNNASYFTGLSVVVPTNTSKVLTVYFVLNTIGTGAGTSQSNARAQIDATKYSDSNGTQTPLATDYNGNELYVYKSVPTVSQTDLTNSTVVNGQPKELYKFTVTASSQGAVSLKQFVFPVAWNDGGVVGDTLEVESLKLYEDGVDITSDVVIQDQGGTSVESTSGLLEADSSLLISWVTTKEGVVGAGATKTYVVKGTPQGFNSTDATTNPTDSVSLYLGGSNDAAHNSTKVFLNGTSTATTIWGLHTAAAATGSGTLYDFIWSDQNLNNHTVDENANSTGDWANGYKVLNLSLDTETWED